MSQNIKRTLTGAANEMVMSERLRVSGILESKEGVSRPAAARELALRSDLSAEQAIALLATMPVDNPFMQAMQSEGQIGIGAQAPGGTGGGLSDPRAAREAELRDSMQHFNAARGYGKAK